MDNGMCAGPKCYKCSQYGCWHNMTEAILCEEAEAKRAELNRQLSNDAYIQYIRES